MIYNTNKQLYTVLVVLRTLFIILIGNIKCNKYSFNNIFIFNYLNKSLMTRDVNKSTAHACIFTECDLER